MTFCTPKSRTIIERLQIWSRLLSLTLLPVSLGRSISHCESNAPFSPSYLIHLFPLRYTEKTLSREGISILTSHHVERVEKVFLPFHFGKAGIYQDV